MQNDGNHLKNAHETHANEIFVQEVTIVQSGSLEFMEHSQPVFDAFLFTALHVMQTRYSDENYVCLSVRLSHAWIVTKR